MSSAKRFSPVIVEVGPRDGIQNEKNVLSVATRAALVDRLAKAGLNRIESVSFVNPRAVPTMAGAGELMQQLREAALPCTIAGLVLNARGAQDAVEVHCDEANLVVVASDTFSTRNQGRDTARVTEQLLALLPVLRGAGLRTTVTVGAAFGCPFEGEVQADRIVRMLAGFVEAGCDEVALADTIGVATPRAVRERFQMIAGEYPGVGLRAHFHDTRSAGMANVIAGLEVGVTAFDSSVGGFGGCPFAPAATGNIATEDLVYLLQREGIDTGVDLDKLIEVARWLSEQLERPMPGGVANAGGFPSGLTTDSESFR